jgi:hypothetical protein
MRRRLRRLLTSRPKNGSVRTDGAVAGSGSSAAIDAARPVQDRRRRRGPRDRGRAESVRTAPGMRHLARRERQPAGAHDLRSQGRRFRGVGSRLARAGHRVSGAIARTMPVHNRRQYSDERWRGLPIVTEFGARLRIDKYTAVPPFPRRTRRNADDLPSSRRSCIRCPIDNPGVGLRENPLCGPRARHGEPVRDPGPPVEARVGDRGAGHRRSEPPRDRAAARHRARDREADIPCVSIRSWMPAAARRWPQSSSAS